MKQAGLILVLTMGCAVAVQTAHAQTKADTSKDRRVTVTGCVQREAPHSSHFILSQAVEDKASKSDAAGSTYVLEGATTDIEPFDSQRVEIDGKLEHGSAPSDKDGKLRVAFIHNVAGSCTFSK
jgi:hypothetical protein